MGFNSASKGLIRFGFMMCVIYKCYVPNSITAPKIEILLFMQQANRGMFGRDWTELAFCVDTCRVRKKKHLYYLQKFNQFQFFHDSSRKQYGVTVTRCCSYSCFVLLKMGDSDARNMYSSCQIK